ncbi:MAG: winged helix-turn-helix domain-containing protein [Roseomonas sp.]|nr:winged helix-turn-helix domain-containing protein [Roseomonas sp.]
MRTSGRVRFGGCVLDPARGRLSAPDGTGTVLRAKTLSVLMLLLENAGRAVSQDEILDNVWPDVTVSPGSVTQCMSELRQAMGPEAEVFLKTLPRRGYMLAATPEQEAASPGPFAAVSQAGAAPDTKLAPQEAPSASEGPRRGLGPVEGAPVLAVLPFRNSAMPGADLMAEGIVEDIVHILAGMREPAVISTNSTRRFRNQDDLDLPELADRLGANYLVTGNVRQRGETTQIAVELTEARQGLVVWSRVMEVPETSLFAAQADIAASIANALVPWLNQAEFRATRRQVPEHLSAYHLLLRARSLMFEPGLDAFQQAGLLLDRAVERDPDYAPIYAAMIDWRSYKIFQGWSVDREADSRAMEEAARAALARDPFHARALAMFGHNRTIAERRYDEALSLLDRAVAAGPNDAEALMWTVPTLAFVGRSVQAIERAERAIKLSPQDPHLFRYEHFLSIAHYAAGNYEYAAELGMSSYARNPKYLSNLRITIGSLSGQGRLEEARSLVKQLLTLQPDVQVEQLVRVSPFRYPDRREHHGRLLRLAGVPG